MINSCRETHYPLRHRMMATLSQRLDAVGGTTGDSTVAGQIKGSSTTDFVVSLDYRGFFTSSPAGASRR